MTERKVKEVASAHTQIPPAIYTCFQQIFIKQLLCEIPRFLLGDTRDTKLKNTYVLLRKVHNLEEGVDTETNNCKD